MQSWNGEVQDRWKLQLSSSWGWSKPSTGHLGCYSSSEHACIQTRILTNATHGILCSHWLQNGLGVIYAALLNIFFYSKNVKQLQNLLLLSLKGSHFSEWWTWGRCFHSAGSFMGQDFIHGPEVNVSSLEILELNVCSAPETRWWTRTSDSETKYFVLLRDSFVFISSLFLLLFL